MSRRYKSNLVLLLNTYNTLVRPVQDDPLAPNFDGVTPNTGMEPLPGMLPQIERWEDELGYLPVAIHNAGGISAKNPLTGAPYLTFDEQVDILRETLRLYDGRIRSLYFCPDFGGKWCYRLNNVGGLFEEDDYKEEYRIPRDGMVRQATDRHSLVRNRRWVYVGDAPTDAELVENSNLFALHYLPVEDFLAGQLEASPIDEELPPQEDESFLDRENIIPFRYSP